MVHMISLISLFAGIIYSLREETATLDTIVSARLWSADDRPDRCRHVYLVNPLTSTVVMWVQL